MENKKKVTIFSHIYTKLLHAFLNAVAGVCACLPHIFLRSIAYLLAFFIFYVLRLRRKLILQNISNVLGDTRTDAQKHKIAFQSVYHFLLVVLEFFASHTYFKKALANIENRHILEEALAHGRGAYILCIHMGNWELLCHAGSRYFAPVHVVAKPIGSEALDTWITQKRHKNGMFIISRKQETPAWKQILQRLEQNQLIGFIVDQRRTKGMILPFCQKPAQTNVSLFRLWKNHPAPIIPCTIKRINAHQHVVTIHPIFVVEENINWTEEDFLRHNALRMNLLVEELIKNNPEEYFWFHNRWKIKT